MKIVLTNNFFEPLATGSTHFTRELAAQLARNGHEVLVITATPAAEPVDFDPPKKYRLVRVRAWRINLGEAAYNYDIPFASRPSVVRAVFRLLNDFRPDVIHQNGQFFDLSFITGAWARRHHVPTVLTVHTALIHESPRFDRVLKTADRYGVRPVLSLYRPTLVSSDKRVGKYVSARYPTFDHLQAGYPVDIEGVQEGDGHAIREILGIGDRPMILSLGHVIPQRNRMLFIQALQIVQDSIPDVVGVVVGNMYDRTFLDEASRLKLLDSLVTTGAVPHSEIKHYLAAAEVESHDLQGYGIGISTLEAMSTGTPVVTVNDADTFPYAPFADGENVMIAEPTPESVGEHLVSLLTDSDLRRSIGNEGRRYVLDHFTPARIANEYEKIYTDLQQGRPA